jgi:tetratricopeptide (TPR) repeat protein
MIRMLRRVVAPLLIAQSFLTFLCGISAAQLPEPITPPQATATQAPAQDDPERQHAIELYKAGKMVEVMPLLEKLCAAHPDDASLYEAWGVSILNYAQTLSNPDLRKKARVRARSTLMKAKELGDNSTLLQTLLGTLPEDGGENKFSPRKDVDDAMQQAEADFARGDLDKAREGYLHASQLDPHLYEAPLFVGDVYFKQHLSKNAIEWFARAVAIDSNREIGFRYWGDALWELSNSSEAREKYILAVLAEPYNRQSWIGLTQWAKGNKVTLNWVRLRDKSEISQKDDKNINIKVDPGLPEKSDLNTVAWTAYGLNRALWKGDKFKREFPKEPKYRRTAREEADCLHRMVAVLLQQKDYATREQELDPGLQELVRIDKAGFIGPFALLNRADPEIGQDYAPYRSVNRDLLYHYFDEIVVPKTPVPTQ